MFLASIPFSNTPDKNIYSVSEKSELSSVIQLLQNRMGNLHLHRDFIHYKQIFSLEKN